MMPLEPCQVQLVRAGRTLTLGPGTPYTLLPGWDPWSRNVRADQGGPRPHAHGSWVGTEWMEESVVLLPVSVYRNGSTRAEWLAAHQELAAVFAAVGASGETCELRFEWGSSEYVMFGRPRQVRVEAENVAVGKSVEQCAFVCADPRIYSAESTLSTPLPIQQGGVTVPAGVASTRLRLPGEDGSYASTPDHASLDITTSLDVRGMVYRDSWEAPASEETIAAQYADSTEDRSWRFSLDDSGFLLLQWSTDGGTGTITNESSTVAPSSSTGRLAVRATLDLATGDVTFYTASSLAGPWTQLGDTQTGAATSIYAGPASLEVGARDGGTNTPWDGIVYAVEVYDGAALVADPDFTDQAPGDTSFTDSTGKLWSIHGDAALVGDTYTGGLSLPFTVPGVLVGGTVELTNTGTAAAGLTMRIDGPAVEPKLILRGPDGTVQSIAVDVTLTAGQWLEIDTTSRLALLNGLPQSNQRGRAVWDMDAYPLVPGTSTIRFGSAVFNTTALLTVTGRSAWW